MADINMAIGSSKQVASVFRRGLESIENLDEELLRYEEFFSKHNVRGFQEIVESTRNHSDLLLDFLEIVGHYIPDIFVPVFV